MKAIILARVSSKEQEENNSIPAQTRRLLDYSSRHNLQVIETYQLVESSTKANRKKFSSIIDKVRKSKEAIALITDTIDRLQRSFKESVQLDELRKANKVELHFVRENLVINRNSNSADLLRWDMGVLFAKSYVTQLTDNVNRSIEEKRKNGELSTHAPFGYRNCRIDGKAFVEPDENAPIVYQIFEQYSSGVHSIATLRKWLLANYNLDKSHSTLDHILKNPFYYGFIRHNKTLYAHKYQKIISKELFDKVQSVLNRSNKTPYKYSGLPFIYRGLIVCSDCGCRITAEKQKDKYVYYHCTQHNGKHGACFVREESLNEQIMHALSKIQPSEEQYKLVIETIKNHCADIESQRKALIASISAKLATTEQRISRLFELYLDGELNKEEYRSKRQELNNEKTILDQKLGSIDNDMPQWYDNIISLVELIRNAPLLFEQSSRIDLKRQILNLVFSNFKLCGKELRYKYNKPFDSMVFCENRPMWSG